MFPHRLETAIRLLRRKLHREAAVSPGTKPAAVVSAAETASAQALTAEAASARAGEVLWAAATVVGGGGSDPDRTGGFGGGSRGGGFGSDPSRSGGFGGGSRGGGFGSGTHTRDGATAEQKNTERVQPGGAGTVQFSKPAGGVSPAHSR